MGDVQPNRVITLLDDDLGNCVLEFSSPARTTPIQIALRSLLSQGRSLDMLLTKESLAVGFQFCAKGWTRVEEEYILARQGDSACFVLGAQHLMDYYKAVLDSCTARAHALLSTLPSK
jgi:hypothetical protein